MQDNFYRAFEDKYRGSRKTIKDKLTVYLPFIEPFKNIYKAEELKVLDLGCGRGEWIELVNENGFFGLGVDIDEDMLKACKILNLNAIHADALGFLQKSPDESFVVVSGFHIAEHLPFDVLQNLIKEALRVLKPGGLLILETPNPENIRVASVNFWLDPTHIRPLPPLLLLFLTEYYGFARAKILRLQEDKNIKNLDSINLLQVLYSSSPDYAIIAQKDASTEITTLFNEVFSKEYGITLESLSEKFQNHILNIENKALEAENRAIVAEKRAIELENQLTEAENKIIELFTLYNSLLNSKSWKITYPLRLLGRFARWFKTGAISWITFAPESRPRRVTIKTITKTKEYLDKNPKLKSLVKVCLKPFPGLQDRLKEAGEDNKTIPYDDNSTQIENSNLSSTARKVYDELKKAIEERKKYENLD
ncbi:MAG: class I SAM-dependent methyltransferase [Desulfurella sp.]|jgi:O-antigen chain-terminating methyltransferase